MVICYHNLKDKLKSRLSIMFSQDIMSAKIINGFIYIQNNFYLDMMLLCK